MCKGIVRFSSVEQSVEQIEPSEQPPNEQTCSMKGFVGFVRLFGGFLTYPEYFCFHKGQPHSSTVPFFLPCVTKRSIDLDLPLGFRIMALGEGISPEWDSVVKEREFCLYYIPT